MQNQDPTKRIPKSLGTDTKLFGRYTLTDVAVGLLPSVVVVLVTQVVLPSSVQIGGYSPQALTLPIAALTVVLGALFVHLTPEYATSADWVELFARFYTTDSQHDHDAATDYTHLERVHPDRGVIERTDGAFVGLLQVTPPPMALATDEEWQRTAEAFQDFCNATVEFPIQIYSTTRSFPVEEYLAQYEQRLEDPDVQDNPQLAALIENYIEWYAADLEDRRMTIRDHYVIVPVTPDEVQFEHASLLAQLAALPVVGVFVRALLAPHRGEQRAAMFDALDKRLQRIEAGLREIEGCNAHRVDAETATELVEEFWTGEQQAYGDRQRVLRTRPLVGGARPE